MNRTSLEQRFWKYVEKTNTCWLWNGYRTPFGYGRLNEGGKKGVAKYTHRISWFIHKGEIADKLKVLHKCDNPPCVNPDHLFIGTQKENMFDCVSKGRHLLNRSKGINNPASKLNPEKVKAIRRMYMPNVFGFQRLAKLFEIDKSTVASILRRETWANVL